MVSYINFATVENVVNKVLILIVVEDGLVRYKLVSSFLYTCLNPYCSGRWSRTVVMNTVDEFDFSLNPYCSGRWSHTKENNLKYK